MYTIGIDLGGTNIVAGLVDENYRIVAKAKTPTAMPRDAEPVFDDIARLCREVVTEAGIGLGDVKSIGVGTPGSVNKSAGVIEFANNLGFDNVPAYKLLHDRTGVDAIYFDNDANCAALGEVKAGCGAGVDNFVAITLGTGVGSGIIVNGKLVTGVNYAAGELGHMVIKYGGEQCNCGRRGCWERYSSATALIQQTKDAMRRDYSSLMWEIAGNKIENVDGRTAFDAMRKGDKTASKVVEQYVAYLAVGVANIINIFQPEIICVGGGVGNEGENLLAPLRKVVATEIYSIHATKQTKIVPAKLGNDAGVIGAAALEE